MRADRSRGQVQPVGDLPVGEAIARQVDDLTLLGSELGQGAGRIGCVRAADPARSQLGFGITTVVSSAALYLAVVAAVVTGKPDLGALVLGCFGAVRGLTLLSAWRVRRPDQLIALHARLKRWRTPARTAGMATLGAIESARPRPADAGVPERDAHAGVPGRDADAVQRLAAQGRGLLLTQGHPRGDRGGRGRRRPVVTLEAHGIAAELPQGWSGTIFRLAGGGATLHAATFTLVSDHSSFGDASTAVIPTGGSFLALTEYLPGGGLEPGVGLFAPRRFPRPLDPASLRVNG